MEKEQTTLKRNLSLKAPSEKNFTIHDQVACKEPYSPITGSLTVPECDFLFLLSEAKLAELKPTKVYSYVHTDGATYIGTFGM
jgi:hypothetical protein